MFWGLNFLDAAIASFKIHADCQEEGLSLFVQLLLFYVQQ